MRWQHPPDVAAGPGALVGAPGTTPLLRLAAPPHAIIERLGERVPEAVGCGSTGGKLDA